MLDCSAKDRVPPVNIRACRRQPDVCVGVHLKGSFGDSTTVQTHGASERLAQQADAAALGCFLSRDLNLLSSFSPFLSRYHGPLTMAPKGMLCAKEGPFCSVAGALGAGTRVAEKKLLPTGA